MKFRQHRGSLIESISTEVEVNGLDELLEHLAGIWSAKPETIRFSHVGLDLRVNWDTYYVLVKYATMDREIVVGMSDSCFDTDKHFL